MTEDGYGGSKYSYNEEYNDTLYGYDDYNEFSYTGFSFEKTIYLYVWCTLVVLVTLHNIPVIVVFLCKELRAEINVTLVAIAVSDTLTGLVTLPGYFVVYQSTFVPPIVGLNGTHYAGAYVLTAETCDIFMITKFYVVMVFHTISIWLTVFLAVKRYIAVAFPLKVKTWPHKRITMVTFVVILCLSTVLHVYHLINDKSTYYECNWHVAGCEDGACVHLWAAFLIQHMIPCILLVVLTILFVCNLWKGASKIAKNVGGRHSASTKKRSNDKHRVSIIVIAVVVVILIPEVPYGIFLLYIAIRTQMGATIPPIKTNRSIQAAYEITLLLSFHANFYIYTLLNRRFRCGLKKTLIHPIFRLIGIPATDYESNTESSNQSVEMQ